MSLTDPRSLSGRVWPVVVSLLLAASLVLVAAPQPVRADGDWWDTGWYFRVPVVVDAAGYARSDKVAEAQIDFGALMSSVGYGGELDPASIRVLEVDADNAVLDAAVPFQFDAGANPNAGVLSFLMTGSTGAGESRTFHVYFNPTGAGSFTPPDFASHITLTDNVTDEGFASYQLQGANSTLFFHKRGGGFSGLEDQNGNDWINWNSTWGHGGDYRGIPNLVHPNDGGYFHPGRTTATSAVTAEGPLKVSIVSTVGTGAGTWKTQWDVFPDYARLTVLQKPDNVRYWFQYEGVPGGTLDSRDRVVRPNGNETNAANGAWSQDLPNEEWAYIYDPTAGASGRSFYMISHQQDSLVDSYWAYGLMSILGFGRNDANGRFYAQTGLSFTFGLADGTAQSAVEPVIHNAYQPLLVTIGPVQQEGDPPQPPSLGAFYLSAPAGGKIELGAVDLAYGDEDVLRYDDETNAWSLAFDGSAHGLPGAADVDGFTLDGTDFLLSFDAPIDVPGIPGKTDDSDIVRYTPGVGFSLAYDMSAAQFGLTTADEDVDAIALDSSGRLLISTLGSFGVPGAGSGRDEDLLRWNGTTWELAFDGSHHAGLSAEDITGASLDPATGDIFLTILGAFSLPGAGPGNGADVTRCTAPVLGPLATACTYMGYWDAASYGINQIDALDIVPPVE